MSQLQHARGFRDLIVYQKTTAVAKRIFELTKRFPRDETYSLTDQVRRSSRSVGAQIAEAWAKRRYEKHFVSKLTDADGEQQETQHWIDTAADCGYLTDQDASSLNRELAEIGRMLNSMIEKAPSFCGDPPFAVRESAVDYFTTPRQRVNEE
ncbi:MAG: four helix bundle protein [Deltaproteobacteria bacterium]|nr:four helix bundle protein [Deltaproteobacteria bacterium]